MAGITKKDGFVDHRESPYDVDDTVIVDGDLQTTATDDDTKVPTGGALFDHTQTPVATGTTAPSSTPTKVGDMYVDTTAKNVYIAAGTASSADWIIVSNAA